MTALGDFREQGEPAHHEGVSKQLNRPVVRILFPCQTVIQICLSEGIELVEKLVDDGLRCYRVDARNHRTVFL